jgi:diketogulonate reductase-like aldo/keto reductase
MGKSIHSFELKNGARIPSVGLGTWRAAPGVVGDVVTTAVKVGWFFFLMLSYLYLSIISLE